MKFKFLKRCQLFGFSCLAVMLLGCGGHQQDSEEQLLGCVDSFSKYYYNWEYFKLSPFVTPSSLPWVSYACSQVTQADLDLIHSKTDETGWEVTKVDYKDDSTAVVSLTVTQYLAMDSIGRAAQLRETGKFEFPVVRNGGKWQVVLRGMLRPLKD